MLVVQICNSGVDDILVCLRIHHLRQGNGELEIADHVESWPVKVASWIRDMENPSSKGGLQTGRRSVQYGAAVDSLEERVRMCRLSMKCVLCSEVI